MQNLSYLVGTFIVMWMAIVVSVLLFFAAVPKLVRCIRLFFISEGMTLYVQAICGYCDNGSTVDGCVAMEKSTTDLIIAELESQFDVPKLECINDPIYGDCVCIVCLQIRGKVRG